MIEGSEYAGLIASDGGGVSLENVIISESGILGTVLLDKNTLILLQGSIVRDTGLEAAGFSGSGVFAGEGAGLVIEDSLVESNRAGGIQILDSGTEADIHRSVIRDSLSTGQGDFGDGLSALEGSRFSLVDSLVDGNSLVGVGARHTDTVGQVVNSVIRATRPEPTTGYGRGLEVVLGARLTVERSLVDGSRSEGVTAWHSGTDLTLSETVVRATEPDAEGRFGQGVIGNHGSTISCDRCLIEGNLDAGISSLGVDTVVTLKGTIIRDTDPDSDGEHGEGAAVDTGASLDLLGCLIRGNTSSGVAVYGIGYKDGTFQASELTMTDSAVIGTRSGIGRLPTGDVQKLGDGVFVGAGSHAVVGSSVILSNARTGIYFFQAFGTISGITVSGNQSYGLALEDCIDYVQLEGNEVFGNALGLQPGQAAEITINPGGLTPPTPPEVDDALAIHESTDR